LPHVLISRFIERVSVSFIEGHRTNRARSRPNGPTPIKELVNAAGGARTKIKWPEAVRPP
jgi:hypothetical protein